MDKGRNVEGRQRWSRKRWPFMKIAIIIWGPKPAINEKTSFQETSLTCLLISLRKPRQASESWVTLIIPSDDESESVLSEDESLLSSVVQSSTIR